VALQIHPPAEEVHDRLRGVIQEALPDAQVEVEGAAGHFVIRVVSKEFEGKNTLAKQRLVLAAIAPLMKGEGAPVHAIDRLETRTP
jgi:acid stress-induced BolA-like protein IbaG/YrbA